MPSFREFLDKLFIESWQVIRLSARNQAVIHDNFSVSPYGTGIFEVLSYRVI
jgi:hypothetical protein